MRRGHSDARLVILVDLTYKRGGLHVDGEDRVNFFEKCDEWDHIAKSLREGNVLGFSSTKCNLSLQPTDPKNRAVCVHDDIAGTREYILSIRSIGLNPSPSKIRIDITFETFRMIRLVNDAPFSRIK